ncbi:MAG: carbon starvation protein A [Planctomycetaceae bacterium]|nr:MAG: carbon starvation protein A [Planctomycetaceae bacterium]
MSLLGLILITAGVLLGAYRSYSQVLSRLLRLDPQAPTPAFTLRDDVDYQPLEPNALLSQHFSAIAAAGPIVGPILAGLMFGWLPALLWIVVGSILIGGVHDFTALVASIRHKARSIAEVVRDHMSRRAYLMFLSFVWLALVYIIVAFTDITAASFVGRQALDNGEVVTGAGIASSSLMYLALPIIMGLLLRYSGVRLGVATAIFLPLVALSIYAGQRWPFDLTTWLQLVYPAADDRVAHKVWDILLLIYCCIASVVPMWLLLQPRGHLGGYFLYVALGGGMLGLLVSGIQGQTSVTYPAFTGWWSTRGDALFPMLFITIACGACSGFHALIASGTTSKQLRYETDARLIGYGAMLLEAMVAVLSLCCVMRLAPASPLVQGTPNLIYAEGIGSFLQTLGIPAAWAVSFALMAFTTFVYDTLDVCTRLGRYIIQELIGRHDRVGRWIGTLVTAGVPVFFVMQTLHDAQGQVVPLWRVFWALFGASNQLLAALTLLGVTVWLWKTTGAWWVWLVTGLPTLWMYTMSTWALARMIQGLLRELSTRPSVPSVTYILLAVSSLLVMLALFMLVEASTILWPRRQGSPPTAVSAPA